MLSTLHVLFADAPPAVIFWENVPGVLSTKDNAFGCFLAGLAGEDDPLEPPGGKWTNAGCVSGPQRTVAWRVLDAQYFGVAQRRRRVFVVASARKGFDPATVLFEWDGVRRDSAPSREARQVAPTIPARSTAGGGLGTDFDCDGGTICVAAGQAGAEIGADMAPTLNCNHEAPYVAHSLRGEGFDASEDGPGRGTPRVPHVVGPLACNTGPNGHDAGNFACNQAVDAGHVLPVVPVAYATKLHNTASNGAGKFYENYTASLDANSPHPAIVFDTTQITSAVAYGIRTANTSSNGWGVQEEYTHTLDCAQGVAVAQPVVHAIQAGALRVNPASGPDGVGVQADHAYTLEARAEVQAVAYTTKLHNTGSNNAGKIFEERTTCLDANSPPPVLLTTMAVRRLLPEECEKLQGFEPGYTAIPWRGKPADQCPDGPRYRALGNSWAVPNVRWIGERIQRHLAGEL